MKSTAQWSGLVLSLSLAVFLGAGGCGKSDEVSLKEFGEQASQTTCDKVYECCSASDSELAMHMNYSGGREECGRKSRESMGFWAAIIGKEQERGRLSYDPKLARRCLDAFAAASCETHKGNAALDACDTFITPKTPPGSPCNAGESCMGGGCVGLSAEKEGVCRAYVAEGGSCAESPCGKGLFCEPGSKTCKPRKSAGASCNLNGECQSEGCNGRNPDAGTAGTCGAKGGEQTRCFVTSGCSYGGSTSAGAGALLLALLALVAVRRRR
jgi:MYXO-CTERM domain-containing protein